MKANSLGELKRYDEAVEVYDEALKIDELFVDAIANKRRIVDIKKKEEPPQKKKSWFSL
jgi:tetratricopeptide (TPR) repeat protein